ncbi:MAG: hypothetical protein KME17_13885 [Cyanosarcina radialis HA8281-LM2]|jgi:hypothetical protein|nr:hypothetical protein [Cyanosarcina radialis HA8281-LM2]
MEDKKIDYIDPKIYDDLNILIGGNKSTHPPIWADFMEEVGIESQEELLAARERISAGNLTIDDYLLHLLMQPEIILGKNCFVPGTLEEKGAILNYIGCHVIYLQLLRWLLLESKPQDINLSEVENVYLASARLSKAVLDLANELYPRFKQLQVNQSALELWFIWECQRCEKAILDSGLITGSG